MNKKLKKTALRYRHKYKFSIFPVNPKTKSAILDRWEPYQSQKPSTDQIETWWEKWPDAAIGIATGPVSNLLVLDIDSDAGWKYVTEEKRVGPEPPPIVKTGGGGYHIYYKYPEGSGITIGADLVKDKDDVDIDWRGDGGYVLAPPSGHPSGGSYKWKRMLKDHPPIGPPGWLFKKLKNKSNDKGNVDELLKGVAEGNRNNAATKVAGRYLANFDEDNWDLARNAMRAWNERNDPPLPEDELEKTFKSIAKSEKSKKSRSQTDDKTIHEKLLEIAEQANLFRTGNGRSFAEVTEEDKSYLFEMKQKGAAGDDFRHWLIRNYKESYGDGPSSTAVSRTMTVVRADCAVAEKRKVHKRVADLGDRILIDLAGNQRRAVEITPSGYKITENLDVNFWRPSNTQGLPEPEGGVENLKHFRELTNLEDQDFSLLVAWLLMTFQTEGPYPVLIPTGPAGAAKSTLTKMIRKLLDPAGESGRATTNSVRQSEDLYSIAKHRHILALDNISKLKQWQSDTLSAVATGGGLEKRQLYTDSDIATIDTMNPIVMNGIDISGIGDDLLDRAIFLHLEEPTERVEEEEIWNKFDSHHGQILGGLCDALTTTLKRRNSIKLTQAEISRMADFTRWVKASRPAIQKIKGLNDIDPLEKYHENRTTAGRDALMESDLGTALVEFLESQEKGEDGVLWKGKTADLLEELEENVSDKTINSQKWPSTASVLGRKLSRMRTSLKKVEFVFEKYREQGGMINEFRREIPF